MDGTTSVGSPAGMSTCCSTASSSSSPSLSASSSSTSPLRLDPFPVFQPPAISPLPSSPATSQSSSSSSSRRLCHHSEHNADDGAESKRQKLFPSSPSSPYATRSRTAAAAAARAGDELFVRLRGSGDALCWLGIRGTPLVVASDLLDDRPVRAEDRDISAMRQLSREEKDEDDDDDDDDDEEDDDDFDEEEEEDGEEDDDEADGDGSTPSAPTPETDGDSAGRRQRAALLSSRVNEGEQQGDADEEQEEEEEDEQEEEMEDDGGGDGDEEEDDDDDADFVVDETDLSRTYLRNIQAQRGVNALADSPERIDSQRMAAFAQQTRSPALYSDRYHANVFLHHRLRSTASPPAAASASSPLSSALLASAFIPNDCTLVSSFDARVFCGRFSSSGAVYLCATQDAQIHLYRPEPFRLFKRVDARGIGWSVIDVDTSHDERFLLYSSWSNCVQLVNVPSASASAADAEYELHEALDLKPQLNSSCMFCIRFSPSDTELLAGLNSGVMILFDIERKAVVFRAMSAHQEDINAVCFLDDSGAGNVFATGSDDNLVKVWDRRSQRCVGGWIGSTGGITSLAACCDGQYVLSNSKDHSLRLHDLRSMNKLSELADYQPQQDDLSYRHWSRRIAAQQQQRRTVSPLDRSLCTYVGHTVQQTLIRAAFSPASVGRRYVYSGSADGAVYIWDAVGGQLVSRLAAHHGVVREVSWSPDGGALMSSSWDGGVKRWEYRETADHPLRREAEQEAAQ